MNKDPNNCDLYVDNVCDYGLCWNGLRNCCWECDNKEENCLECKGEPKEEENVSEV